MTLSQSAHDEPKRDPRSTRQRSAVVGRAVELGAIEEAVEAARDGISGVSLEGEPGIGKSRLLLAAAELAVAHDFVPASVSADEEIRGPFMLARGLLSAESLREGASDRVVAALDRACDLLSGRTTRASRRSAPRTGSSGSSTRRRWAFGQRPRNGRWRCSSTTSSGPTRTAFASLRYVIRTQPALPVFFAIAIRPEEAAQTPRAA